MDSDSSINIRETIGSINRGTGITNNMMAYRLALIIKKEDRQISRQPTVTLNRQVIESDLRNILTRSTQNTENYRQELKDKYFSEYLNNFGFTPLLEEAEESVLKATENTSRVETLIVQKKEQHLKKIIHSSQSNNFILNQPTSNNLNNSRNQPARFGENEQSNNKPLIRAILETTIAQGKDTQNEGRVYEGVFYKLQLLIKDGVQFVNVYRNQDKSKALASHKNSNYNEFTITENNLSTEEANKLIAFNNQRITKEHSNHELHSNDSSELEQ